MMEGARHGFYFNVVRDQFYIYLIYFLVIVVYVVLF
jgi:hypothetical protein